MGRRSWLVVGAGLATAAGFGAATVVTGFLACGISGCGGGGFGPVYAPRTAQVGLLVSGLTGLPLALYLLRGRPRMVRAIGAGAAVVVAAGLAMLLLRLGPNGCPWGQSQATAGPDAFTPGSRTCSADRTALPK